MILVASSAIIATASSLIVRYDERRLRRLADAGDVRAEQQLERAWPPAGRDNALIGLALLAAPLLALCALFFHFFRTRSASWRRPWTWSPTGALLGLVAVVMVVLFDGLVLTALAAGLGLPLD